MLRKTQLSLDHTVSLLKAAGEHTRLRLLALLAQGDLTVSDLIDILGQSQPRISRHLKLLSEAGLVERYQEGAWAYFRAREEGAQAQFVQSLLAHLGENDPQLLRDVEQLENVRARRAAQAEHYFAANAAEWDEIRSLHVDEGRVEAEILKLLGDAPFEALLDLGTGTGRMLELLSGLYQRGIGIDASREMLAIARANLDQAGLSRVQVRQGDILNLAVAEEGFDLVTIHQVLHYLENPAIAIRSAARGLKPGGRLLIVDFAPHDLEFLREKHAHIRLGFAAEQMNAWLEGAGLEVLQSLRLSPNTAKKEKSLVVTLWLAADPRTPAPHEDNQA
ncbi:MAG: metalloregulator ArsR/SmtB family transcription factor [Nitratireductor sp.]|nr:metalloregulator ArsR/SmtB family transcription factor [Nitratireductor sp.]